MSAFATAAGRETERFDESRLACQSRRDWQHSRPRRTEHEAAGPHLPSVTTSTPLPHTRHLGSFRYWRVVSRLYSR